MHGSAGNKRVAGHVSRAAAHRQVINDVAFRVEAACTDARVATFVQHARLVARAIGVDDTFRSAADKRVSEVLGYACAHSVVTPSVLAAR